MPPRSTWRIIAPVLLLMVYVPVGARAEGYVAGFAGAAFPTDPDVTLTPQFGQRLGGPEPIAVAISRSDVVLKDVKATDAFLFGGKAGWFLEHDVLGGQFGLEAEVSRFRPELQPMGAEFSGAIAVGAGRRVIPLRVSAELEDQPLRVITLSGSLLVRRPLWKGPSLPYGRVQLYAGPGLAGVFAHLESNTLFLTPQASVEDSDGALAIQGIGGVKIFLTKHIAIFSEYKVLRSGDLDFHFEKSGSGFQASAFEPPPVTEAQDQRFHLMVHQVYGGVAIHF